LPYTSYFCTRSLHDALVIFLGKMTEPEAVLASCDLFVLTSETESFGLAALEAMACGVPVVSTDAGGTSEVEARSFPFHWSARTRSEEHTSELQSRENLVCRL